MLEFPCDFPIKIIYKNVPQVLDELLAIVRQHYPTLEENKILHNSSVKDKYQAITVLVHATNQTELDALYRELSHHPQSRMVL